MEKRYQWVRGITNVTSWIFKFDLDWTQSLWYVFTLVKKGKKERENSTPAVYASSGPAEADTKFFARVSNENCTCEAFLLQL